MLVLKLFGIQNKQNKYFLFLFQEKNRLKFQTLQTLFLSNVKPNMFLTHDFGNCLENSQDRDSIICIIRYSRDIRIKCMK